MVLNCANCSETRLLAVTRSLRSQADKALTTEPETFSKLDPSTVRARVETDLVGKSERDGENQSEPGWALHIGEYNLESRKLRLDRLREPFVPGRIRTLTPVDYARTVERLVQSVGSDSFGAHLRDSAGNSSCEWFEVFETFCEA